MHNRENTSISHMFDAYCKKVIKNQAKDVWKEKRNTRKRMVYFSEMSNFEKECLSTRCTKSEFSKLFYIENYEVRINNSDLAEAIEYLESQMRNIVLLYFFVGFKDIEISKILNIPRSTVQNNRSKALKIIKLQMGEPKK